MKSIPLRIVTVSAILIILFANGIQAQTTAFTYQGKLTESGLPPTAIYDMQFRLFDIPTAGLGTQQGATVTNPSVQATGGIFTAQLDFGAAVFAAGADLYLEISIRPAGSAGGYSSLAPRQRLTSAPYAIRAVNAAQLNGVAAANYLQTNGDGSGLTNVSANAANLTGIVSIANGGTNSATQNFVDLTTVQTVTGSKTFISAVNTTAAQYNIGGSRILGNAGTNNLFAGINAGTGASNTGTNNSFIGRSAGFANTTGSFNSFVGANAGQANTTGSSNSFFGTSAGFDNTTGNSNSFVGAFAGQNNTTGSNNSFFGAGAGFDNLTGSSNSFFGTGAGNNNTTGFSNSFFGLSAGFFNTTGAGNSFFGRNAGNANTTGASNSFFGESAGQANTTGISNSFFGRNAGFANTTGFSNSFFGESAGDSNTTGGSNSFFGRNAGDSNTTGASNSFFGESAGQANTTGFGNSFFGRNAGFANTTGATNSFVGASAGSFNTTGASNSFIGTNAGNANTLGDNNSFFGRNAGETNTTGDNNTVIGKDADVGSGVLTFATALGSGAVVSNSNNVVLGRTADTVRIPGNLVVTGTVSKGGGAFRIDHPLDPQNKYLYHSFVESPDMMNVYNGNTTTDERGEAVVTLPDYFDALNRDFRYQLTVIGQFAQAIVGEEIKGNSFVIRTDKPGVKVSWQVTGIRKDKFANENRIQVEVEKTEQERNEQKPQREK